jgi:hypothetical protein
MNLVPLPYKHEHYRCPSCARDISADDISDSWRCNVCTSAVAIYAEDATGRRKILNRLSPAELHENFCVVIPGAGFEYIYKVICVTPKNGNFRVALRSYRAVDFTPGSLIECVIGAW